jgi:hypothetical protein
MAAQLTEAEIVDVEELNVRSVKHGHHLDSTIHDRHYWSARREVRVVASWTVRDARSRGDVRRPRFMEPVKATG